MSKNKVREYLVTDLDRTMVFSKRFYKEELNLVPVEYDNGKVISYMTPDALSVVERKIDYIIPATTRSLEEFKRVKPFQKAPWAVVGNGSIILYYGEPIKEWSEKIAKIKENLKTEYHNLVDWLNTLPYLREEIKAAIVEGFIFAKIKLEEKENVVNILEQKLKAFPNWQYVIQKNKLYILPKKITKEAAVEFIIRRMPGKFSFAGDGKLDVGMLELSNNLNNACTFIPMNSDAAKLSHVNSKELVDSGPEGAERTLRSAFTLEDNTDVILQSFVNNEVEGQVGISVRTFNAVLRALNCFDNRLISLHYSRKIYPEIGWQRFVSFMEEGGMEMFKSKSRGFGEQTENELSKVIKLKKGK